MLGKEPHLSPNQLRKELLVAESELNRAQLSQEWHTMVEGIRGIGHHANTLETWISSAAWLTAGFKACQSSGSSPATEKPSWLGRIVRGASLVLRFWPIMGTLLQTAKRP